AVADRDGEHALLALHRLHLVDEAAHRLDRGRETRDQAAVVERHFRPDGAADGLDHQIDHFLAPLGEIRVRIFLEQHDDVGEAAALFRQVAVRVELDADHAARAYERAGALEKIAFAVVVTLRHHGAVQVEHDAVYGERAFELA